VPATFLATVIDSPVLSRFVPILPAIPSLLDFWVLRIVPPDTFTVKHTERLRGARSVKLLHISGLFAAARRCYSGYSRCSLGLAFDRSSGFLAPKFSDVKVEPHPPMIRAETVVVHLTACAVLRLVANERQLT
jgi:hypothetical protein